MHAARDQLAQPRLRAELGDIALADAGRHAGEQALAQSILEPAHRTIENLLLAAPIVARDFPSFDRNERCRVADLSQLSRDFLRDELAVGEDLEIRIRMFREEIEQLRVHEGLAAENPEKRVPMVLRVIDRAVQRGEIDLCSLGLDVDPATLAAQIARVQDRKIQEWRKVLTAANTPLESLHTEHALHSEVPKELAEAPWVCGAQDAECELRKHGRQQTQPSAFGDAENAAPLW